jgi:hypothetical protein
LAAGLGIRSSCSSSMSIVNGVFGTFNTEKNIAGRGNWLRWYA